MHAFRNKLAHEHDLFINSLDETVSTSNGERPC